MTFSERKGTMNLSVEGVISRSKIRLIHTESMLSSIENIKRTNRIFLTVFMIHLYFRYFERTTKIKHFACARYFFVHENSRIKHISNHPVSLKKLGKLRINYYRAIEFRSKSLFILFAFDE